MSKGFGELIGRYYSDQYGLRAICLRIGWVWEEDTVPADFPRVEAIWLSHRDCARLLACALGADEVRLAGGVRDLC